MRPEWARSRAYTGSMMVGSGLDYRILGAVELWRDGRQVDIGGPRLRALLGLLVLHRNRVVSTDRLIDLLWGERPPSTAANTLHVLISHLRRALNGDGGEAVLVTRRPGYELRVAPGRIDLERFETLCAEATVAANANDYQRASARLGEALALWRDDPMPELVDVSELAGELGRIRELRLAALEAQFDAELALGRHRQVVTELEAVVSLEPLRELFRSQLMLALYRCGRQVEALDAYRDGRQLLVDALGVEPGPELREMERRILVHDPTLRPPGFASPHRRSNLLAVAAVAALVLLAAGYLVFRGDHTEVASPASSVVLIRSNRVVASAAPVGPGAVAMQPNGTAWVSEVGNGTVTRVSASGATQTAGVGGRPTDLAWGFGDVWIGDAPDRKLLAYDPATKSIALTVRLARTAGVVAEPAAHVAVGGGSVWVDQGGSAGIRRIDPTTGRTLAHITGVQTGAIAFGLGSVWVAGNYFSSARLDRIDPRTNHHTSTPLPIGTPVSIAVADHDIWIVCTDATLWRIDPRWGRITSVSGLAFRPVAVSGTGGGVWVAGQAPNSVSRIDPHSGIVQKTIPLNQSPTGIAANSIGVWVTTDRPAAPALGAPTDGTVTVALSTGVDSIDPAITYWPTMWQIEYATGLPLLSYPDTAGPDGERLTPGAATALPDVSNHGRTYTFTVRPNLRFWPTRQPVTARSFRAAVERALSPGVDSTFARDFMADLVGAQAFEHGRATHVTGIHVLGPRQISFTTTHAHPDFPTRIAMPFYAAIPPNTPDAPATTPIPAAGPYYIAQYTPGRALVLARNPGYPGPRQAVARRIVYRLGGSTPTPGWQQVADGQADYDADPASPTQLSHLALTHNIGVRLTVNPKPELRYLVVNTHSPSLRDPNVRRAIALAIDRQALAATLGPDAATATDQYLPPADPGYPGSGFAYPLSKPNIHAARQLIRRSRVRLPLTLRLSTCLDAVCRQDGAPARVAILRRELAQIGIRLTVRPLPRPDQFALDTSGVGFDLADEGFDFPDPDPGTLEFPITQEAGIHLTPAIHRADHSVAPARYAAWRRIDINLARNSSPLIAYAITNTLTLTTPSVGCLIYQPEYGIDLTRLCSGR
jgi:DNA-binding SARP family transcriptional activator/ABC-type transport system substrate-binding protein